MPPVPVRDPVVGQGGRLSTAWESWFHRLKDVIYRRPSCHVAFTADQTIANSTATDILWNAEDHDTAGMHDKSSNTDQVVIPEDGIYCVGAHVRYYADADGNRTIYLTVNDAAPLGSGGLAIDQAVAANQPANRVSLDVCITRAFNAGDVLRVLTTHNAGNALDLYGTGTLTYANAFWCFKVSNQ
jgi:hypothetical protein